MADRNGVRGDRRLSLQIVGQSLAVVPTLVEALVFGDEEHRCLIRKAQAVGPDHAVLELLILRTTRGLAADAFLEGCAGGVERERDIGYRNADVLEGASGDGFELRVIWQEQLPQAASQRQQGSMCLARIGGQLFHAFAEMHDDFTPNHFRNRDPRIMPTQIKAHSCPCAVPQHLLGQPNVRVEDHSQCHAMPLRPYGKQGSDATSCTDGLFRYAQSLASADGPQSLGHRRFAPRPSGTNPSGTPTPSRSIPVTWVTDYSEDMGNTFGTASQAPRADTSNRRSQGPGLPFHQGFAHRASADKTCRARFRVDSSPASSASFFARVHPLSWRSRARARAYRRASRRTPAAHDHAYDSAGDRAYWTALFYVSLPP